MDSNKLQEIANDALMGIKEAAAHLDVSPSYIRERCSDKYDGLHIKSYRIANRLKFRKSELDDYINFYLNTPASGGKAE
jgi:hypothetical protein